jgi:hypothetical protein
LYHVIFESIEIHAKIGLLNQAILLQQSHRLTLPENHIILEIG